MLKKIIFVSFLILFSSAVYSNKISNNVKEILIEFTQKYKQENPDGYFKPNVAVIKIIEASDDAKKHYVGEAIQSEIESLLQNSTVFSLLDRKNLNKILSEIEFSQTGMVNTERLQAGNIQGVDIFIDGTLSEVGSNFVLQIRAVDANTSKIIFSGKKEMLKSDIIDIADKIAAAYVSPYGIGIEELITPLYFMNNEMTQNEGSFKGLLISILVTYRFTSWLYASAGIEFSAGKLQNQNSMEKNYSINDVKNISRKNEISSKDGIRYEKRRYVQGIVTGAGYVFNITREFNISSGMNFRFFPDYTLEQSYITYYNAADNKSPMTQVTIKSVSGMFTLSPFLKLQYFLTPRLALHTQYEYSIHLGNKSPNSYEIGGYTGNSQRPFEQLYSLNPEIDPTGKKHITDFTGQRIGFGVGLFF
ncbi:MAG: hypothetical protein OEZ22_12845 [Spirochaetia bacterium]|nr:hypothetical protein [Spirochaetia bacterium]